MSDTIIQIPATFSDYRSMSSKNGAVKIIFETQEAIPSELMSKLLAQHDKFGWLSFLAGEREITPEEVASLPILEEDGGKSPAQRQRAVIYRIWEANGKPMESYEVYYRNRMAKNLERLKEELEGLTV